MVFHSETFGSGLGLVGGLGDRLESGLRGLAFAISYQHDSSERLIYVQAYS